MSTFTETVTVFGPMNRLVGILTTPALRTSSLPAILILSSGITDSSGPNRTSVYMARFLAEHGYSVLRFDLPGIGDSEMLDDGSIEEQGLKAMRAAADLLQGMGVASRFVLIGHCLGADRCFEGAEADDRVVGAVFLEPPVIFTTRRHELNWLLHRIGKALRKPRKIWEVITGARPLDVSGRFSAEESEMLNLPRSPPPSTFAETRAREARFLTTYAQRRVRLFYLFTGFSNAAITYTGQIADAFPEIKGLRNLLRVELWRDWNHNFARESWRQQLYASVLDWLTNEVVPVKSGT
ncbi:MAG: alpha/beta fold hydrolase [Nevskiaceae bacterium]|jgi:pimeloyl-ACP methyl ester carboxylesterase|nr:alpha/beta fold hydrolase [Nevskiaceae bacterium]